MTLPGVDHPRLVLSRDAWRARETDHAATALALTAGHRARRMAGRPHPVEDFLFTYYRTTPGRLARWHPGPGVVLTRAAHAERGSWRFYAIDGDDVVLDETAYLDARGDAVRFVRDLLQATATRAARYSCFGLHEWAMVYGLAPGDVRHNGWPLRLGREGTDAVVESLPVTCSHFDAYRFFTPSARPLNALTPRRETQIDLEQPGCLHATMDLYKWAGKLGPLVPGELLLDAFALARDCRVLDMEASPYDLRGLGYQPVCIETFSGRTEYAARQRELSERGQVVRSRLLALLDAVLATGG